MKIYTKKGDKGKTSLLGNKLVTKDNRKVMAYGDVDELNSFIGYFISLLAEDQKNKQNDDWKYLITLLIEVQHNLFNIGTIIASAGSKKILKNLPQVHEEDTLKLEEAIDDMEKELPGIKNFILPGGDPLSGLAHILRTICRRGERNIVHCINKGKLSHLSQVLIYMNRLSDFFFVFSRYINLKKNQNEIFWIPKK